MAGERKRGEWDGKIESSGYQDGRSVTEKKKRHIGKGERCLSKLGRRLTRHFGHILIFISPKWPQTVSWLLLYLSSFTSPISSFSIISVVDLNVSSLCECLPPLGPGSGGPRLVPPHEFPVHPLSLFTLIFFFLSHSSLWLTARRTW